MGLPDITMCVNKTCPLRHSCYRSPDSGTVGKPSSQSYALWTPTVRGQEVDCEGYWERGATRARRRLPDNNNQQKD